jgi:uncharacterized protein (DUF1015 family)
MAKVLPFSAIRPASDKVHLVASRSVDTYENEELKEKLSANPFTFLHVINPDYSDGKRTVPGSPERLKKVRAKFASFKKQGVFVHDSRPSYYVYRQLKGDNEYLGLMACAHVDDYLNGVIRRHEQTITQRELKLKEYLDVCEFNAEPVLFSYPEDHAISSLLKEVVATAPEYDFSTTDKVRHSLWVIGQIEKVNLIESRFATMPAIYIADGHHRCASSALLAEERRKKNEGGKPQDAYNAFLGVFFSESQLRIYDYNRLVKDMNGLSPKQLIDGLSEKFNVTKQDEALFSPSKKHELSMYLRGTWYKLEAKPETYDASDPVKSLDSSILTEQILAPFFGISDLRIDKRIAFVAGTRGPEAMKKSVDEGKSELAFGLYPVTMQHLKWIADTNNIMPPKTTWVEPKMRSGLVIYAFEGEK